MLTCRRCHREYTSALEASREFSCGARINNDMFGHVQAVILRSIDHVTVGVSCAQKAGFVVVAPHCSCRPQHFCRSTLPSHLLVPGQVDCGRATLQA